MLYFAVPELPTEHSIEYIYNSIRNFISDQFTIREIIIPEDKNYNDAIKLYELTHHNTSFILKITNKDSGNIFKVAQLIEQNFAELKNFLIIPIVIATYNNSGNVISYQLMYKAPGQSVAELFDQYLTNQLDVSYLNNCYFKLGETVAYMHKKGNIDLSTNDLKLLKTQLLHNDLHDDNILYDGKSIYLIDNEGINVSINNPSSVDSDLSTILFQTTHLPLVFINNSLVTTKQSEEIIGFTKYFLKGYISQLGGIEYTEYLLSVLEHTMNTIYQSLEENQQELLSLCDKDTKDTIYDIIVEPILLGEQ
ncbi:MAG: hypothetical protein H6909_03710 [Rickettsiaceae bacterium]|nr:hypothetical protein [Rickettsiaceae bacterium]